MGDLFTTITNWLSGILAGWGVPAAATAWIFAVARAFLLGLSGLLFVVFLIWFERKAVARMQDRIGPNRVGPFGLFQPFADLLKLVLKEDFIPPRADRPLFQLAPILAVMGAVGFWAVIPIAAGAQGADLDVGVLFLAAAASLGTLAVLLAGWSSNNPFALLGAFRAVAQLVSYGVPALLAALVPVMLSGTMRLQGVVAAQREIWFAAAAPLAALAYLVAALAETARAPFDLLEAESEIVGGFHVEYSGIRFGMFYAAEFLHAFTAGALFAVLFLGGWQGPGAEEHPTLGALYFVLKAFGVYSLLVWARGTLPRVRIDRMLDFCWKVLTPAMIVLVGTVAVVGRALAENPGWVRTAALCGANLLIAGAAAALLGRRPRPRRDPHACGALRQTGQGRGGGEAREGSA
ncbi:MAG: NADH-quinone oxidoreductase subunit NuoH [Anaerolineales bacterium]|nr:NADH-quinone oxidoreductase subunit NuoH [Anaerolineales bacterium]